MIAIEQLQERKLVRLMLGLEPGGSMSLQPRVPRVVRSRSNSEWATALRLET